MNPSTPSDAHPAVSASDPAPAATATSTSPAGSASVRGSVQNLLVAVTGESPAVVTETVFGLYRERGILIDRIVVITTTRGAEQARLQLLVGDEGRSGPLERLCQDYGLPKIRFTERDILIVPGENGQDVDDARSEGDQRALADFITQQVRQFTDDPGVRVIASLAGGRKTMTFFLGYAMSLFGRPDDLLTHVLVSEPFEQVDGFYYPTPQSLALKSRRNNDYHDAARARVTLIQIPFVRMREEMPGSIIRHNHSYTATVDKLNYYYDARRRSVVIDTRAMTVTMEGEPIPFSPTEYAFYAMFARDALANPIADRGFFAPKDSDKGPGLNLVYSYLSELLPPGEREQADQLEVKDLLERVNVHLRSLLFVDSKGRERSGVGLREDLCAYIEEKQRLSNFADLKRRVIEAINKQLGERLGERYHPLQAWDEERQTRRKNSAFRLELDADCITLR